MNANTNKSLILAAVVVAVDTMEDLAVGEDYAKVRDSVDSVDAAMKVNDIDRIIREGGKVVDALYESVPRGEGDARKAGGRTLRKVANVVSLAVRALEDGRNKARYEASQFELK